ncbi:MAG: M1 family metallopeptidase [Crocinitomicaceae bacterium]
MKLFNLKKRFFGLFFLAFTLLSCESIENADAIIEVRKVDKKEVIDYHSNSNFNEVQSTHLHLDLEIDFNQKKLIGSVTHKINQLKPSTEVIFDIKSLIINKVEVNDEEVPFQVNKVDELLGSALSVPIGDESRNVRIFYETKQTAEALMWLSPLQTKSKKTPFLFTQGEAILTRSWIPCQDTPSNRITYSAEIKCDSNLMVVMSATNPKERSNRGVYQFEMPQPIPTYLIAMGVGDLVYQPISNRTGVYAEKTLIDKATYEFHDVEKMIQVAEELYGTYAWDQYDILVLPPAFPFGGMENPRLTFATPTIIAGDRSLVSLIAHELAHSWSGNLVTNATWDDFWLNEGFTVYFENRIMEALYGKDRADMEMAIEVQELQKENADILAGVHPEDTKLKLDLKGRNPDDGMTAIAYVKGALFLQTLEQEVGREKFDAFISQYFETHQFQTLTTETFIAYLNYYLLEPNNISFNTMEWVYEKNIPNNARTVISDRFVNIDRIVEKIDMTTAVSDLRLDTLGWSTQEWMHFIRQLPNTNQPNNFIEDLDDIYGFSKSGNAEIKSEWFIKAIQNDHHGIRPYLEEFLVEVGRRKFLEPIYKALARQSSNDLEFANSVYLKARKNYHAISYKTIDEVLGFTVN